MIGLECRVNILSFFFSFDKIALTSLFFSQTFSGPCYLESITVERWCVKVKTAICEGEMGSSRTFWQNCPLLHTVLTFLLAWTICFCPLDTIDLSSPISYSLIKSVNFRQITAEKWSVVWTVSDEEHPKIQELCTQAVHPWRTQSMIKLRHSQHIEIRIGFDFFCDIEWSVCPSDHK